MCGVCSAGSCELYKQSNFSLVTVIITTFGDCSPLPRAVTSVLNQGYENIELIVVDDNGDNSQWRAPTEEAMGSFVREKGVAYLRHQQNMNGSAARNTGIERAVGRYLTFLDNDDFMLGERVGNAVQALEESGVDACFCDVLLMRQGRYSSFLSPGRRELGWGPAVR